jgi:hypothetical protein
MDLGVTRPPVRRRPLFKPWIAAIAISGVLMLLVSLSETALKGALP